MQKPPKAILDTHTFVWFSEDQKIADKICDKIESYANNGELYISSISLWEIAMLVMHGKIKLNKKCSLWLKDAIIMPGLNVANITPEIAIGAAELPNNFHGDPADRIIVSTAMSLDAVLFTRDSKILDLPSEYVKCIEV
ncbi:MAG: type II toxin-antitoxin system VapC family toxin [Candidatus Paracaedibacteraceae bacterium]|nr:type II toxin-antitoxin system VapC family toxin [Candidatus Paracaedibacteraceae bacterium]